MKFKYKTKPWPHQKKALKRAFKHAGYCLGMGMGTGKSKVAIDLINNKKFKRVLIVCPTSVIDVWPHQFKLHSLKKYKFILLRGTPRQKEKMINDAKSLKRVVFIVSYESMWRFPIREYLLHYPLDIVILDESHRIKSPGSKTSRFAHRLADKIKHRLALTGSLVADKPIDVYSQFKFIDKTIFGTSKADFIDKYIIMDGFIKYKVKRVRKPKNLAKIIKRRAYVVETKDVLKLPPVVEEFREGELIPKTRKIYNELEDKLVSEYENGLITINNVIAKNIKLHRLCSGVVLHQDEDGNETEKEVGKEKIKMFADIMEDMPENEPIVVFCRFRHDITSLINYCNKRKLKYSELSGKVKNLKEWQKGKTQILIAQVRSGSEGIDLTRAKYCIYYSISFSLMEFRQSKARVHRPGQTRSVTYIYMKIKNTVDEIIFKAIQDKADIADLLIKYIKQKRKAS